MTTLKTRLTNLSLVAAAVAAFGLGAINFSSVSAATPDGPDPEQPSCSNVTFDCTSIKDQLAYECYFTEDDWCETELPDIMEFHRDPVQSFKVAQTVPPPPTAKSLVAR